MDDQDEGYPDFRIAGYGSGGSGPTFGDEGSLPRGQTENFLEFRGGFNLARGDQNLSFGAELDFEQVNDARSQGLHRGRFTYYGDYTGDAFADFLLGNPDSAIRGVGSERGDVRRQRWKFFARDDWRLNPRFSLSFSLAYNYFVFPARNLLGWFGKNFPFFFQELADSSPAVPEIDISNPFESITPTELTIRALDPHLRSETVQEWRLTIQNEIFQNWTWEASYIGRKQNGRAQVLHGNTPFPAEGSIQSRRPNPDFGKFEIVASRGSAIGHSLEASLVKRLSSSFSLRSSFRWGSTFSDFAAGGVAPPSNPYDISEGRAPTEMPVLRFSMNYLWELPFGEERAFPLRRLGKFRGLVEGWRSPGSGGVSTTNSIWKRSRLRSAVSSQV